MARIRFFSDVLDFTDLDLLDLGEGAVTFVSSTQVDVSYADGFIDRFQGTGFVLDQDNNPTAGTLTSYTALLDGQDLLTIDEFSIAATTFGEFLDVGDTFGLIALVLEGPDTYVGFEGSDGFFGFGGDDTMRGFGGDDALIGDMGSDYLIGGTGHDLLVGDTLDTVILF